MTNQDNQNIVLYTVGLLALGLAISLFAASLYIMSYMLLNFDTEAPEFLVLVIYWYQTVQGLSGFSLVITVLAPWLIAALFMSFVAKRLTRRVDSGDGGPKIIKIPPDLGSNFMKYLQPAMYELFLIIVVIGLLIFTESIIVMQYQ